MDNIDKFLNLFSDFDLLVVPKQERQKQTAKVNHVVSEKVNLQKALKRLEKEYKLAVKSFKANKLSKSDLHDFEWRIFELREEIRRLEDME